jgi:hypothetical protein
MPFPSNDLVGQGVDGDDLDADPGGAFSFCGQSILQVGGEAGRGDEDKAAGSPIRRVVGVQDAEQRAFQDDRVRMGENPQGFTSLLRSVSSVNDPQWILFTEILGATKNEQNP